jgi:hypothetical protein
MHVVRKALSWFMHEKRSFKSLAVSIMMKGNMEPRNHCETRTNEDKRILQAKEQI